MKLRAIYFLLVISTIAFGLISRKIHWLPLATGDALYAVMMYWGFRFILFNKPLYYSIILSLLFCFGIEFLQLVEHKTLIRWRNNAISRLVFGQGFLWTDLLAYVVGALIAYLIDRKFISIYFKTRIN